MAATTDASLLVRAAAAGDETSWEELVDRFVGLLWSVVRSYRLDDATAADVVQTVWVRLAENLERIRDPARIGAWLTTTAKHESLRVLRQLDRQPPSEIDEADLVSDDLPELGLLTEERDSLLWRAFKQLSARCQQLLRLLVTDPPVGYEQISDLMGMPVGTIGPTRGRCLEQLRAATARLGLA